MSDPDAGSTPDLTPASLEPLADPLDGDVLGAVVEEERGSLPFSLVHGESLVACASWALGAAGVEAVALGTPWTVVQESVGEAGTPFVLHDALCPLLDADEIARCVRRSAAEDVVVVGVRPVTDTVKIARAGELGETVDRDDLAAVASPVVLPPWVVADLERLPSVDFAALTTVLQARYPVVLVEVPAAGRRVASPEDVRVLEALTAR
ncbi:2-C-methyl-D-erythritol 4-phosphate cytidylyltransferase [Nocardioides zeae]|uniref:2-C-methyl-D-erythritol 4-phosphate cytidylyltransferase n=1 Tax=Nocardioides imazamoxiresistens TaxID=3231893 RepID=A0ABU3PY50_9ACTN|nr:2-C-methyl-D-erythritol 4-phosphate cytidylyltransferase [Nocardioides zeae]MDT9594163.1 2-C-methyl-D-erythritol 4-phosphate cytidylyltransferase [Nocardioides zeae]